MFISHNLAWVVSVEHPPLGSGRRRSRRQEAHRLLGALLLLCCSLGAPLFAGTLKVIVDAPGVRLFGPVAVTASLTVPVRTPETSRNTVYVAFAVSATAGSVTAWPPHTGVVRLFAFESRSDTITSQLLANVPALVVTVTTWVFSPAKVADPSLPATFTATGVAGALTLIFLDVTAASAAGASTTLTPTVARTTARQVEMLMLRCTQRHTRTANRLDA